MKLKFLRTRWQKIGGGVLLFAVLLVVVSTVLINWYWSPILASRLKATVLKSTDGLYQINFSKSDLHVLQGKIVIENVVLTPDTQVYHRKKLLHTAPNTLFELRLKKIVFYHIQPLRLYFDRELNMDEIIVSEPEITVRYEQNRDQDTLVKNKKTPYQYISKVLKRIHINRIFLSDVQFHYINNDKQQPVVADMNDININATDFLLDSLSAGVKQRFLFCRDVTTELNNIKDSTAQKRYVFKCSKLKFSTSDSVLRAYGITYMPKQQVLDFFKGNNDDYFAIKLDTLRLNHFDYKTFSKYHKVIASGMSLVNGSVQIFSNPAPDDTTIDQSLNFPHVALGRFPSELSLDSIKVRNANVYFTDYNKKNGEPGTVNFRRIDGAFFNITNSKERLKRNNQAKAFVKAYFMNYGLINAAFSFNLNDENAGFTYKGHLGKLELNRINPASIPLGLIKVSSGKLNGVNFDLHGSRFGADGTLTAVYRDLRVSIFKNTDDNKLKKMSIASLLANQLVIKRDNPSPNSRVRVAKIHYQRKISGSVFNLMWKSIFSGIKQTVGLDPQTEAIIKQKIAEFKQDRIDNINKKAQRIIRREERRKRRALKKQQSDPIVVQTGP